MSIQYIYVWNLSCIEMVASQVMLSRGNRERWRGAICDWLVASRLLFGEVRGLYDALCCYNWDITVHILYYL